MPDPNLANLLTGIELALLNAHLAGSSDPAHAVHAPYLRGVRDTIASLRLILGIPTPEELHPLIVVETESTAP